VEEGTGLLPLTLLSASTHAPVPVSLHFSSLQGYITHKHEDGYGLGYHHVASLTACK